jgi:hypothetical protein
MIVPQPHTTEAPPVQPDNRQAQRLSTHHVYNVDKRVICHNRCVANRWLDNDHVRLFSPSIAFPAGC